jgi:hypothetical protein
MTMVRKQSTSHQQQITQHRFCLKLPSKHTCNKSNKPVQKQAVHALDG